MLVLAQNHCTDGVAFQIQRHAEGVPREFKHFPLHDLGQTVYAHDAISHGDHGPLGSKFGTCIQILNAALDQLTDFGRIELHVNSR